MSIPKYTHFKYKLTAINSDNQLVILSKVAIPYFDPLPILTRYQ